MFDMAEIVNDAVWPEKFPWDEWLDGQVRILKRGEDFIRTTLQMQNTVLVHAARVPIRVRTHRIDIDRLQIQAHRG